MPNKATYTFSAALLDNAPALDFDALLQLVNVTRILNIAAIDFKIVFIIIFYLGLGYFVGGGGNNTLSITCTIPLPAGILARIFAPPIMGSPSTTSTFT